MVKPAGSGCASTSRRHCGPASPPCATSETEAYLSLALRDEYAARARSGPEILTARPPITSIGGHCWFLRGKADGAHGLRAAITEQVKPGVDVIRIAATTVHRSSAVTESEKRACRSFNDTVYVSG